MIKLKKLTYWIKVVLFNVLFLMALLALAEVIARATFDNPILMNRFHEAVQYDSITTRSLKPNTTFYHESLDGRWEFRTNSYGFRMDYDPKPEKAQSTIRVLLLGDSHTQGMESHHKDTFAQILSTKKCYEKSIEIINTGISGSGTSEHLVLLKPMLKRFQPDLVIEAFYPNDLLNNYSAFHKLENGELRLINNKHPALTGLKILKWHNDIRILRWLSQNSYLYSALMNYGWSYGKKLLGVNQDIRNQAERLEYEGKFSERQVDLFNSLIQEMGSLSKEHGAKFYVINIPGLEKYEFYSLLNKENQHLSFEISYPKFDLHVKHGTRHINSLAHKHIANALIKIICDK